MASIKQLKEHANADINTDNDDLANLLLDPGTAEAGAVSSSASPLSTVAVGDGDEEAGKMPTDSRAKLNGKQQAADSNGETDSYEEDNGTYRGDPMGAGLESDNNSESDADKMSISAVVVPIVGSTEDGEAGEAVARMDCTDQHQQQQPTRQQPVMPNSEPHSTAP